VTGSVQNRTHAVPSSGIDDKTLHVRSKTKISYTESQF